MKNINIGRGVVIAALVVTGAVWTGRVAAQTPQPGPDVLPALLEEVRGLRAAMEQMASAGPRIQLFTSRLQLQETRINNMVRRLDTVRDNLANAQKDYARTGAQQQQFEAALSEQRASSSPEAREEAKQAQFMIGEVKREAAMAKSTLDRLTAEEAQLLQDINVEQARWTDINARLDELERALAKR
jgi:chromosome segregation ATPase